MADNLGVHKVPKPGQSPLADAPETFDGPPPESFDGPPPPGPEDTQAEAFDGPPPNDEDVLNAPPVDDDHERLRTIMDAASRQASDTYAQVYDVARKSGLAPAVVNDQLPALQKKFDAAGWDPGKFKLDNPALAKMMLERPQAAPVIANDLDALQKIEQTFRGMWRWFSGQDLIEGLKQMKDVPNATAKAWKVGELQYRLAKIAKKQMAREATLEDIAQAHQLDLEIDGLKKQIPEFSFISGMLPAAAEQAPRFYRQLPEMGYWGTLGATAGAAFGPAGAAAGASAGLGYGVMAGIFKLTSEEEGALFYREAINKGVEHEAALRGAHIVGTLNGALEAAPVDKVLRLGPGANALLGKQAKDWVLRMVERPTAQAAFARLALRGGEASIFEGATEGLQEITSIYEMDQVQGGTLSSSLAAVWRDRQQVLDAARLGAQAGGGTFIASPGTILELQGDLRQAQQAERTAMTFQALGQAISESKTFQKLPETAKEFVRAIQAEHGIVESLSAPAGRVQELLTEAGVTDEEIQRDMPTVAKGLAESLDPDDEIAISTEDLSVLAAKTKGFQAKLAKALRVNDGITAEEAPEIQKKAEKILKDEEARAKASEPAEITPGRKVYESVLDSLTKIDLRPLEAARTAALWQAFAESRGSRLNKDPYEWFKSKNITFARGEYSDLSAKEKKSPRTLTQEDQPSPELDPYWASSVDRVVANAKQAKGDPKSWLSIIKKDAKKAEVAAIKLPRLMELLDKLNGKDLSQLDGGDVSDLEQLLPSEEVQALYDEMEKGIKHKSTLTKDWLSKWARDRLRGLDEVVLGRDKITQPGLTRALREDRERTLRDLGVEYTRDQNGVYSFKYVRKATGSTETSDTREILDAWSDHYGEDVVLEILALADEASEAWIERLPNAHAAVGDEAWAAMSDAAREDLAQEMAFNEIREARARIRELTDNGNIWLVMSEYSPPRLVASVDRTIDEELTTPFEIEHALSFTTNLDAAWRAREAMMDLEQAYPDPNEITSNAEYDDPMYRMRAPDGSGAEVRGTYTEMILRDPSEAGAKVVTHTRDAGQTHFSEERRYGYIGHIRFSEHLINGKRALAIDEVQSDRIQSGRKIARANRERIKELGEKIDEVSRPGFWPLEQQRSGAWEKERDAQVAEYRAEIAKLKKRNGFESVESVKARLVDQGEADDNGMHQYHDPLYDTYVMAFGKDDAAESTLDVLLHTGEAVRDTPFKDSFDEIAVKRMLLWAVAKGYDQVIWTPGDMQIERWRNAVMQSVDYLSVETNEQGAPTNLAATMPGGKVQDYKINTWDDVALYTSDQIAAKLRTMKEAGQEPKLTGDELALEIGGAGFRITYDRDLTNSMRKLLGAEPSLIDHPGIERSGDNLIDADGLPVNQGAPASKVWHVSIPKEASDKIEKEGLELYQRDAQNRVRGFFQTTPMREAFKITFSGTANFSTFAHESAHAFLEILRAEAAEDPKSAEDLEIVRSWLGAKKKGEWSKEHLEDFARGFERYLMEGKAPSTKLGELFASFRAFLMQIYATFAGLDVELTDDVRGVMDRMLATDIEIQKAQEKSGALPPNPSFEEPALEKGKVRLYHGGVAGQGPRWLTPDLKYAEGYAEKSGGVVQYVDVPEDHPSLVKAFDDTGTDAKAPYAAFEADAVTASGLQPLPRAEGPGGIPGAEYAKLKVKFEKAIEEARRKADREALREARRHLSSTYREIKNEATQAAKANVALNAQSVILTGKRLDGQPVPAPVGGEQGLSRRISREWIRKNMGELSPDQMRRLSHVTEEHGADANLVAAGLGFDEIHDGVELVKLLADTPTAHAWIKTQTDQRMGALYPGYQHNPAFLAETAARALHTDEVGNAMWAFVKALSRKLGGRQDPSAQTAIKEAAKQKAASMNVMELSAGRIQRDEQRLAKVAAEAWKAKDAQAAYDALLSQVFKYHLWQAVDAGQQEVQKIVNYLRGFNDLGKQRRLARGTDVHLKAIQEVLGKVDLGPASKEDVALALLYKQMMDEGEAVVLPKDFGRLIKNYRTLTLDQLRGIETVVRNLEHLANMAGDIVIGAKRYDFNQTVKSLVDTINGNSRKPPSPPVPPGGKPPKLPDANRYGLRKLSVSEANAALTKMEFLFRDLDGGQIGGTVASTLFRPFEVAEADEHELMTEVTDRLRKAHHMVSISQGFSFDRKVAFLTKSITVRDALMIAGNVRNEGNFQRMLETEGWSKNDVLRRLDEIFADNNGVDLVNHFGEVLDSLWPYVKETYKKATGVEPRRVTGEDIALPSGKVIKGGYWPIIRDYNRTGERPGQVGVWDESFLPIAPDHGFTEQRAKGADTPMLYDLNVLAHHLTKVVHYVTHYEAVRAVDKFTRDPRLAQAIIDAAGPEKYGEIRPWLEHIARPSDGELVYGTVERLLRHARAGSSIFLMAGKLAFAMKQSLGIFTSGKELGLMPDNSFSNAAATKYLGIGFAKVMDDIAHRRNPITAIQNYDKAFILFRENYDRDLRLVYRQIASSLGPAARVSDVILKTGMAGFQLVQGTVNAVTWYGAYAKAIEENRADPVAFATAAVRQTQSGGGPKDLARIQRGNEFVKMWTVMYTWYSVLYNQTGTVFRGHKAPTAQAEIWRQASQFMWLITLPVLGAMLMSGKYGSDDDDGEEGVLAFGKDLTREGASFMARSVPLVSDAWEFAQDERRTPLPPWVDAIFQAGTMPGKLAGEDEMSDYEWKKLAEVVGTLAHLPTGGAYNSIDFLQKYLTGELDEPMRDLLLRNPSEYK